MEFIILDIINCLSSFIDDKTLNYFLSINKHMYEIKKLVKFNNTISLSVKILDLPYYNSFSSIIIDHAFSKVINLKLTNSNYIFKYPSKLESIYLTDPEHDFIKYPIPLTVTLLDIDFDFDERLIIPPSVKFLRLKIFKYACNIFCQGKIEIVSIKQSH